MFKVVYNGLGAMIEEVSADSAVLGEAKSHGLVLERGELMSPGDTKKSGSTSG